MSPSTHSTTAWISQLVLSLAFIGFGGYGLLHATENLKNFGGMGLSGWFAYLIAVAELLGGIGLLVPATVRTTAQGLLVIIAGAVIMHATVLPGGMAKDGPALVFLLLLVALLRLRRPAPLVA